MDTSPHFALSRRLLRPAALAVALAATLFIGGLWPSPAHAQPVLGIEAGCEPAIRPNETALVTCTASITNSGDEAATELEAALFFAQACALPGFTVIDRTVDGVTDKSASSDLFFSLPDIASGDTLEVSSRVVVNAASGPAGGSITVTSSVDPSVAATADICFDVSPDAAAPPTNLRVTKRLLTALPDDDFEPPIRPPDGSPVPIPPLSPPPNTVDFEILIENVGTVTVSDITLLDVQTGYGVILANADPAATSVDNAAGRATWSLGSLAPGAEARILTTYGPAPDATCAFANDVAIVTATPSGGAPEDYAAFSELGGGLLGGGIPVGECDFGFPEGMCFHFGPGEEVIVAPCEEEVCWTPSPDTGELWPITSGCDQEQCWFYPPEGGEPYPSACADPLCWLEFEVGEGVLEYFPIPCDEGFCEFVAPDGVTTTGGSCDEAICWGQSPMSGEYYPAYGCDEFDFCWFSAPGGGGEPFLNPCEEPIQFAVNPPEGSVDFGFGPPPIFGEDACWPVPPPEIERSFYTYPLPCDVIDRIIRWLEPPNDGPAFPVYGDEEYCWVPLSPEDLETLPPGAELPPDLLIPEPCEDGAVGIPGGSVPTEVVDGVSTPATLEEGTSHPSEFLEPSSRVVSATVIRPEQVVPAPPETPPTGEKPLPEPPHPTGPQTVADVLGLTGQSGQSDVSGLPSAGEGRPAVDGQRPWALAAALAAMGLTLATVGLATVRRRV
jgi:hypothetical protein